MKFRWFQWRGKDGKRKKRFSRKPAWIREPFWVISSNKKESCCCTCSHISFCVPCHKTNSGRQLKDSYSWDLQERGFWGMRGDMPLLCFCSSPAVFPVIPTALLVSPWLSIEDRHERRRTLHRRAPQTTLALKNSYPAFQSSKPEYLNNKISFQDDVIKSDIREIKGGRKIKIKKRDTGCPGNWHPFPALQDYWMK